MWIKWNWRFNNVISVHIVIVHIIITIIIKTTSHANIIVSHRLI